MACERTAVHVPGFATERTALAEVLASDTFRRTPKLSQLLAYICEKQFRGEADSVKEYTVAVEALGRDPQFSTSDNSIVRVQASRLRRQLQRYYETEGAGQPVRIHLPDAGYAPQFVLRGESPVPEVAAPSSGPSTLLIAQPESSEGFPFINGDHRTAPPEPGEHSAQAPCPARSRFAFRGLRTSRKALTTASLALIFCIVAAGALWSRRSRPTTLIRFLLPSSKQLAPGSPAATNAPADDIRILAGSTAEYVDSADHLWSSDQYFSGGSTVLVPDRQILMTLDRAIYQAARSGVFSYNIPLPAGVYELHLHFAETQFGQTPSESDGEGERYFSVTANGNTILQQFDIVSDAGGPNTADERVFRDITPASDGYLHLNFSSPRNRAFLCGISILPTKPGKTRPVRMVAGSRFYLSKKGEKWEPDRYFAGGNKGSTQAVVQGTDDPGLYMTHRWGHFTYAIPVADGAYRVRLRFAEPWFGGASAPTGGVNSRVFDVYCNGVALLRNFDIYKEGGGLNKAVDRTFAGLRPNAQGKLIFSFVPVRDHACINAIEVVDDSR